MLKPWQTRSLVVIPIIIVLLCTIIVISSRSGQDIDCAQKYAGNDDRIDKCDKNLIDKEVAFETLVIAIGTLLLALVAAAQSAIALQADKTANRAVDAAIAANNLTETALIQLEAPRIYPVNFVLDFAVDPLCIFVCFKNYGRSPALIRSSYLIVSISQLQPGLPKIFHKRKDFMVDGYIGVGERSEPIEFCDNVLREQSARIIAGHVSLNVLVHFSIDDVIGGNFGSGRWFVWNWRRQKFVAGVQLWEGE